MSLHMIPSLSQGVLIVELCSDLTIGSASVVVGVGGLFTRGLPLCTIMIGTLTSAQWEIFDSWSIDNFILIVVYEKYFFP